MGTPENDIVIYVLLSLLVFAALVVLFVALTRWLFRINEIVDLLKQIAKTDEKDAAIKRQSEAKDTPVDRFLKRCAVCEKEYLIGELVTIDSGQLLCRKCHKVLENKKGEKV